LDLKEKIQRRREEGAPTMANKGTDLKAKKDENAFVIPIDLIDVKPQGRKSFENLESLANSIKEHGQIHAVSVRRVDGGRYELIFGERRLRAIRDILEAKSIRVTLKDEALSDGEISVLQLVENGQREEYKYLELAVELQRLKDKEKKTDAQLAQLMGKNHSWIYRVRTLNEAPDDVKQRIASGELSVTTYWNNKKDILAKKTRRVLVKVPYNQALELTQLLQRIAEKDAGLEPIKIPKKPKKDDLLKIIMERSTEILSRFEEETS